MNLEKTAINDRIEAIMKDNESINSKLKYTSPANEKKALQDKKAKNNNELRKERTKRYNLEQEDAEFIRECCQYLQKLGIVKSQRQFSQQFLSKSQDYLGMLICERRQPPINILHRLVQNLIQIQPIYEDKYTINNYLDILINRGNQIITKKLLKYL